ncbi:MAG TPA: ABC transporter permease [Gaiellaceae bacterium]
MHPASRQALERLVMAALSFCAVMGVVYAAFFVIPAKASLPRRQARVNVKEPHGYFTYVWHLLRHGDLGNSIVFREPVTTHVMRAAPVTLSLVVGGIVCAIVVSLVPLLRLPNALDKTVSLASLTGMSLHPVWLSLIVAWFFGAHWGVLPTGGYCGIASLGTGCDGLSHWASHLLLPWLVFGLINGAYYSLALRTLLHTELAEDYVREARAHGTGERRIVRVHVLRNIAPSLLMLFVTNLGVAISSVIFIESIFGLPGMGNMFRRSLLQHDLPVSAGIMVILALSTLAASLLADLATIALPVQRSTRTS